MESEKQLVNASAMRNFLGKKVQMFLKVERTSPGGRQFTGMSSDNQEISVNLNSPLNQPLNNWIEVIGTASGPTSIACDEIIFVPEDENSEPFDVESHNSLIAIMHNMKGFYDFGESCNGVY